MALPIPAFFADDDVTPAPTINFGNLIPGTPTAETELHLWNAQAGATVDPMTSVYISVLARFPGDTSFTADNPVAAGRMVQIRAAGVAGLTTIEDQTTVLTPVGKGRWLSTLPIPYGTARKLFISVLLQAGVGASAVELKIVVRYASAAFALELGHYESSGNGILTGTGDGGMTDIYSGGVATATGTPDAYINLTDVVGVHEGVPYAVLAHQEISTNLDSAAAALAAGQSYWETFSIGAAGAITKTKSVKGTTPLDPASRPAVPTGERLLCYVEVKFGLVITTGDIYQTTMLYGFHTYSFSSLIATIHPGKSMIDNYFVHDETVSSVTLTDAATNIVWRNGAGSFDVTTDGTKPSDRAIAIFEATTAGGVVTASRDLRAYLGPRVYSLDFYFDTTLAANQYAYAIYANSCDGYIRFPAPIATALDSVGTGTGGTKFDVQLWDGTTATSIFPSSGTVDRRPYLTVAGAVIVDSVARPETYRVRGWSVYRAKVVSVPGTTVPTRAVLSIPVEVVY
jgi:hypothetical protein